MKKMKTGGKREYEKEERWKEYEFSTNSTFIIGELGGSCRPGRERPIPD